jgi:hypothetical protein
MVVVVICYLLGCIGEIAGALFRSQIAFVRLSRAGQVDKSENRRA